jgi:hypothetical protein
MASLRGHGMHVPLPSGWEGQIFRRNAPTGAATGAVVHAANFAMPPSRGDFGSGAVEVMRSHGILFVLFEHDPSSAALPLFNRPLRPFAPEDFSPNGLQRAIPGQAGAQQFFGHNGRAFTLYAVLGSHALRRSLTPPLNTVLGSVEVDPATPYWLPA